jgi:hypothetical protein
MIFLKNKYTDWYYKIINRGLSRNNIDIFEKHHIIPRCFYKSGLKRGDVAKNNTVNLSLREHYICHCLLIRMCVGEKKYKMLWALHRMCFSEKYGASSRLYENFRLMFLESLKNNHPSKLNPKKFSETMSERMLEIWRVDVKRRKKASKTFKNTWKYNRKKLLKHAIENCKRMAKSGEDNYQTQKIEYKKKYYFGWRELQEATKITKYLYKKYYLAGIDPEFRVGTDGPVPSKENR